MTRADGFLNYALRWAEWGLPIFPLRPGAKAPLKVKDPATGKYPPPREGGFHLATDDPDVIREWWTKHPQANIGGRMGAESGVVAADVDEGAQLNGLVLPRAARVHRTPGGGRHLLYRHPGVPVPRDNTGKIAPGVDWQGDGAYVVLPPSRVNGAVYRAVRKGSKAALTDPGSLTERVRADGALEIASDEQPASRHEDDVTMAWRLIMNGVDRDIALVALLARDKGREEPLQSIGRKHEIVAAVDSAVAKLRKDPLARLVADRVRQLEVQERAQRVHRRAKSGPEFQLPAPGLTLADALAEPRAPLAYTVERLHTTGGNTLLVAQYKTGKTTLLANLLRALADWQPFLGEFKVSCPGRVAVFNYELTREMFYDWLDDIEIEHPERVAYPWNLRGETLHLWDDDVRAAVVAWLRQEEVACWIMDPAARAMRGLVDNENDNAQVTEFTEALDAIKAEAGVKDLWLSTHMGRAFMGEDSERSRGAARLEDWMDHGWYLTKDGKEQDAPRALRAMGRDVDVPAQDLAYSGLDRRLTATGRTREERRTGDAVWTLVDLLLEEDGQDSTALKDAAAGRGVRKEDFSSVVASGVSGGLIVRTYGGPEDAPAGPEPSGRKKKYCWLTEEGRKRRV